MTSPVDSLEQNERLYGLPGASDGVIAVLRKRPILPVGRGGDESGGERAGEHRACADVTCRVLIATVGEKYTRRDEHEGTIILNVS